MPLYVQVRRDHSYLDDLVPNNAVDGLVLNLAYGAPAGARHFADSGGRVFWDPATHLLHLAPRDSWTRRFRSLNYVSNFQGVGGLSTEGLGAFSASVVREEIRSGATDIISPYFLIHDVRSPTLELSLAASEAAREVATQEGVERVWTGLMISSDELKRPTSRDWFLTRVTASDSDHCYLLVDVDQTGVGPLRDRDTIDALREVVRALASNGIQVLIPYGDPAALGLFVDGLYAFATGPTGSLRRLNAAEIRRGRGGYRRASRRYYVRPLLNFLRVDRELQSIVQKGLLPDYGCDCGECPGRLASAPGASRGALDRHYLQGMREDAQLLEAISAGGRLAFFRQIVQNASSTYSLLARAGVQFDGDSGRAHIDAWQHCYS